MAAIRYSCRRRVPTMPAGLRGSRRAMRASSTSTPATVTCRSRSSTTTARNGWPLVPLKVREESSDAEIIGAGTCIATCSGLQILAEDVEGLRSPRRFAVNSSRKIPPPALRAPTLFLHWAKNLTPSPSPFRERGAGTEVCTPLPSRRERRGRKGTSSRCCPKQRPPRVPQRRMRGGRFMRRGGGQRLRRRLRETPHGSAAHVRSDRSTS
jgi:hypothetical protein